MLPRQLLMDLQEQIAPPILAEARFSFQKDGRDARPPFFPAK